jgi:4-hydroxybenzoate polyprenyltransferase
VVMIGLLVLIGVISGRGELYYIGIAAAAVLFIYQQWLTRKREPKACFKAFLNNNQLGMVVFIGLILDYGV